MNEENKISYYSIIPATVRYDSELKPAEKLLYSEITALANRNGYCFAQNRYFANLYKVSIETVSRWIANLQKQGYIKIEIIRNENKEIISRNIYIMDVPYCRKDQYPYCQKNQYPIDEKVKDNNINNNIHDLFILIINKDKSISQEFYSILEKLDFLYTEKIIQIMQEDKIKMIADIIYVLYDIYNGMFNSLLLKVKRETLVNLYIIAQEHNPKELITYYKKSIINKYNNTS